MPGAPSPEYIAARSVLLDALDALRQQLDSIILVGAQAIYLHTGEAEFAVAEYTTDADLALDTEALRDHPKLEKALGDAGFLLDPNQPGVWRGRGDVEVDVMVPEAMGGAGRRGARLGAHGNRAARKARGLEAVLVDREPREICALDSNDPRRFEIMVAGPAALLVAKLHKISERRHAPGRLIDKDALDAFRLLRAIPTGNLAERWHHLVADRRSQAVTQQARQFLEELFGSPNALGSQMAARALTPLEDPDEMAASCAALAFDLLVELPTPPSV